MKKEEPPKETPKQKLQKQPLFEDGSLESKVIFPTKINAGKVGRVEIGQLTAPKRIRGNDRCPCGSNKKYKHCCMNG